MQGRLGRDLRGRRGWAAGRRRDAAAVCLGLALLLPGAASATSAPAGFTAGFEPVVRQAMARFEQPGLGIAVVKDDRALLLKGYGVRRLGSSKPVTPDTLFGLASCSKAFAAATVAALVERGRLDWDDPVVKHVPWFAAKDPWVTRELSIRDILSNRSGLRSRMERAGASGPRPFLHAIRYADPIHPFRSEFSYTNDMFTLSGQVIAEVAGRPWAEVAREMLWRPLDMPRTNADHLVARADANSASPHVRSDGQLRPIPWVYEDDVALPSGGVNSTPRDMANWLRFQLGHGQFAGRRIVSRPVFDEMHRPHTPLRGRAAESNFRPIVDGVDSEAYALGWYRHAYRGVQVLSHTGSIDGFRCAVGLIPERRFGIAVLANGGTNDLTLALVQTAIDLELGVPVEDWVGRFHNALAKREADERIEEAKLKAERGVGRPFPGRPDRLVGRYADDGAFGAVTVRLEKGAPVLTVGRLTFDLLPWDGNVFEAVVRSTHRQPRWAFVRFEPGPTGDYPALHYGDNRLERRPAAVGGDRRAADGDRDAGSTTRR